MHLEDTDSFLQAYDRSGTATQEPQGHSLSRILVDSNPRRSHHVPVSCYPDHLRLLASLAYNWDQLPGNLGFY